MSLEDIGIVAGIIVSVFTVVGVIYQWVKKSPAPTEDPPPSIGPHANIGQVFIQHGGTPEAFEAFKASRAQEETKKQEEINGLREQIVRLEAEQDASQPALAGQLSELLQIKDAELTTLHAEHADAQSAYIASLKEAAELRKEISALRADNGDEFAASASAVLETLSNDGVTAADNAYRAMLADESKRQTEFAKVAYRMGRRAELDVQYKAALGYFEDAARLAPAQWEHLTAMGQILERLGRYSDAEPWYGRALSSAEAGSEPQTIAIATNNLAGLYQTQGRYDEAEPLYCKAIFIGESSLGAKNPHLATWHNNLALLCKAQGRYDEAKPLFLKAIALGKATLGAEHPNLANLYNNLADLHHAQGRYDEAKPLLLKAIAIGEAALGSRTP